MPMTRLEQVNFPSAVHLSLHELEFGDLPLGLAVGPGRNDRGGDSGAVFDHAIGEGCDEA